MKKIIIIIFLSILSAQSFGQVWEDNLLQTNPNASIFEKFTAFKEHKAIFPYKKGNGFKPYARNMDFILKRINENSSFNPNSLYIEWQKQKKIHQKNGVKSLSNWIAKGPINTPIILYNNKKRGNGRVNCIAFDPVDPSIIWVGSPAGGLWKSSDGGE